VANFCTRCGFQFLQKPSGASGGAFIPGPTVPTASLPYTDVRIKRTFVADALRYRQHPPLTYNVPKMLVTDRRLLFLDTSNRQLFQRTSFLRRPAREQVLDSDGLEISPEVVARYGMVTRRSDPMHLSPFWVLDPSLNEELDREFRQNPQSFSRVPGVWWGAYYRTWTWIESPAQSSIVDGSPCLELSLVQVMSSYSGSVFSARSDFEGKATIFLNTQAEVEELKDCINKTVRAGGPLFGEKYQVSLPPPRFSWGWLLYGCAFWGGLGAIVVGAFLDSLGAPYAVTVAGALATCAVTIYFFSRWCLRSRGKVRQTQIDPKRLVQVAVLCAGVIVLVPLAMIMKRCTSITLQQPPANTPRTSVVQPRPSNGVQELRPSRTPAGGVWVGFENAPRKDRDDELRQQVGGPFRRITAEGDFADLCRHIGGQCIQVRDWEGRNFPCDIHQVGHDGTRLALCKMP